MKITIGNSESCDLRITEKVNNNLGLTIFRVDKNLKEQQNIRKTDLFKEGARDDYKDN